MASVNHSELWISMYFYFHFILRIDGWQITSFFKGLNASLISLKKREGVGHLGVSVR